MDEWNRTVNVDGDSPATLLEELRDARPHGFHGMAVVSITMSANNRDAFVSAVDKMLKAGHAGCFCPHCNPQT